MSKARYLTSHLEWHPGDKLLENVASRNENRPHQNATQVLSAKLKQIQHDQRDQRLKAAAAAHEPWCHQCHCRAAGQSVGALNPKVDDPDPYAAAIDHGEVTPAERESELQEKRNEDHSVIPPHQGPLETDYDEERQGELQRKQHATNGIGADMQPLWSLRRKRSQSVRYLKKKGTQTAVHKNLPSRRRSWHRRQDPFSW